MFEFIRKNNKLLTGLLMLLVLPAFVLGGIELYHRAAGAGDGVASVNGRAITQHEWDAVHRQRVQQLRDAQPGLDASLLDTDYAKYQTLERLVEEYAVMEWIAKNKQFVSDQQVQEALLEIPQIAALRGADGQINTQAYADLLRNSGQTTQSFEAAVRGQLSEQQFMQGLGLASSWQPALLTEQVIKPLLQQREVQVAMFPTAQYVAQVKHTDAQLQDWYRQHTARYSVPEQVDVEYLVLDPQAVLKRHPHTDKDLADWYAQQAARYGTPETRRARHILIAADEKADAATQAAAQKKAEDLLKEIKAQPERFADLAQKHSQDPGSAAKGGDLGFFEHKTMVKPFADAAFALKPGEVSGVVKSPFGYHIIRLDDVKPAKVPALQTVLQQVENDFAEERLKQHFASDANLLAEAVAKDRSSLQAAASKLGLSVQTAKGLTANAQAQQLPPTQVILTHPNVQKVLFEQQTLSGKQVSDPITVSPNDVVVLRVTNHVPAHTQAYEAVKAQVQADYVQEKAAELAKAAGQAQLQQGAANTAGVPFAAPTTVSRIKPGNYSNAVVDAALRANVNKLPALEGADLGEQGYAIVRVLKAATESDELAAPLRAQYAPAVQQSVAQAQVQAYLNSIKPQLKVKINVPKPAVPQNLQHAAE